MNDKELAITWLKAFAIETWQRIAFTWTHQRGKLYETTITQNLVFQLHHRFSEKKLPFELWEAQDEKANGNDLELAVGTPAGFLRLPCQAKIINPHGRYSKINHLTNGKLQIESLLDYAQNMEGIAIYLLYNYSNNDSFIRRHWPDQYEQATTNGCSVAPAKYLYKNYCRTNLLTGEKKWRIPSFEELHPTPSIPLHKLIEAQLSGTISPSQTWDFYIVQSNLRYYTYNSLFNENIWKNLTPHKYVSDFPIIHEKRDDEPEPQKQDGLFNPKFRIIIPAFYNNI